MSSHHDLEKEQKDVDESTLEARAPVRPRGPRGPRAPRSCPCLSKEDCLYRMDHRRRGVAAIFNQEVFDASMINQRRGSEQDCVSLQTSYTRLGFEVETYRDLTLAGIEDRLMELSGRDHSDCDCFLLTFMSHGLEGKLRAKDQVFDVNLLWDCFTAERCPSLANKPKIFIIQACQGHGRQGSVLVSSPSEATEDEREHVRLVPSYSLPLRADFLVALSTIPGFVSWRCPRSGSWYIQTLCRQLDRHGFTTDLQSLLTRVSHVVALDHTYNDPLTGTAKKQLPSFISMLIRELRFTKKSTDCKTTPARKRRQPGSDEEEGSSMDRLGPLRKRARTSDEWFGPGRRNKKK